MNKVYAHKNNNYDMYILRLIISLIPLILYGIYKNGIVLYNNSYIDIFSIFKPLFIPLMGFIIGMIIDYLRNKKIIYENGLYGLIIGMIMPININYLLFVSITFIILLLFTFIDKKISFNKICIVKLVIVLTLFILNNYNYANTLELEIEKYSYSILSLLMGRTIGGISISSTILIMISYFYLSLTSYYFKKDIPAYLLSMYLIVLIVYGMINEFNVNYFINPTIYFAFIYIASMISSSPYKKWSKIIYSLLIVIVTCVGLFIFNSNVFVYIGILIASLLCPVLNKIGKVNC